MVYFDQVLHSNARRQYPTLIARPLGPNYNHYSESVRLFVRGQLVKMLIHLELRGIF